MQLGVNLTTPFDAHIPLALLSSGDADFCEFMVDNFLHLAAAEIRRGVGDYPMAFHIMNSHFYDGDDERSATVAERVRVLARELKPQYVSDHLAHFYHGTRILPVLQEVDYERELERAVARVDRWQDLLGCQVWLENFPSALGRGPLQPGFFAELTRRTGCGILYDFSNAVVAEINTGADPRVWWPTLGSTVHGHVAGYSFDEQAPDLAVDTHGEAVSDRSRQLLAEFAATRPETWTVVLERDENIDEALWRADLQAVRRAVHG